MNIATTSTAPHTAPHSAPNTPPHSAPHSASNTAPNTGRSRSAPPSTASTPGQRDEIRIEPWPDHVTAEVGQDPRSAYVERFWLGVVGPSALWLLRTFAYGFDTAPQGYSLDVHNVARALGLGDRVGRHSPVQRAVDRLCHFDLARMRGGMTLLVRRDIPWLDDRQVSRLPALLRVEHEQWEAADLAQSAHRVARRRAAAIAIACARTGGTAEDIAQQLTTWRYPAAGIEELTAWALEQVSNSIGRAA